MEHDDKERSEGKEINVRDGAKERKCDGAAQSLQAGDRSAAL